jgi:acyl transferase domain-containing protein/thioester reductase-like protein/NADPH:quinone reductase-like Zn-dependent oxidoreductase/NAD(P)-dependent dehydrogenase (short-subunit alcohol dehydrogenase family)/SAM-dependent methyltransferase
MHQRFPSGAIAVVGMAVRFPGANTPAQFSENLRNGCDSVGSVPDGRWGKGNFCPQYDGMESIKGGFLSCPVDEFDCNFFGIRPSDAATIDPQHKLLLQLSWEALEDANISPRSLRSTSAGIFTGLWSHDYLHLLVHNGYVPREIRPYMGNSLGAAGGRIARFYGTNGPNIGSESGCSTSGVAVGLAIDSLRSCRTNLALVCGANLLLCPFTYEQMAGVLSPRGKCYSFSKDADGYTRSEGGTVLVLKRLSDAIRDEDRIHAVIRGYGVSQEGESDTLGAPTVKSEALAMRRALADAEIVNPEDVSVLEAHGTGTPVGDPIELQAISEVYGEGRRRNLWISSGKTNIGHTESCSALAGIVKTILQMKEKCIFKHLNCAEVSPLADLESIPATIPLANHRWEATGPQDRRLAGVSSYGITGTDVHIIMEEYPIIENQLENGTMTENRLSSDWFPFHLLTISGSSKESLNELLRRYKNHLLESTDAPFSDIAFTSNVGRSHLSHRAVIIATNNAEAEMALSRGKFTSNEDEVVGNFRIGFAFPGQGSQYPNMGKDLMQISAFSDTMTMCHEYLKERYNIDLFSALYGENNNELMNATLFSQIGIYCLEVSLFALWKQLLGVKPTFVIGHSLGEFAAAVAAGFIGIKDGLRLVTERSLLINALEKSSMLAVLADELCVEQMLTDLQQLISGVWLDIAALNSSEQTVVAGSCESIQVFRDHCKKLDVKCKVLNSNHAFHSRLMDGILQKYKVVAESIIYKTQPVDAPAFISSVTGRILKSVDAAYWITQAREKVQFIQASDKILQEFSHVKILLEIGAHPVLGAMILNNLNTFMPNLRVLASQRRDQVGCGVLLKTIGDLYVNGAEINWNLLHDGIHRNKVFNLPSTPFNNKRSWFTPLLLSSSKQQSSSKSLGSGFDHPILGSEIYFPHQQTTDYTQTYKSIISLDALPYLRDHKLGKIVVMPGAAYIEIMLAAAMQSQHQQKKLQAHNNNSSNKKAGVRIEDIRFEVALPVELAVTLEIFTTIREDNGRKHLDIFSRDEKSAEVSWIRHATAKISDDISNSSPPVDLPEEIENSVEHMNPVDSELFYDVVAKTGINFGESFKCLYNIQRDLSGRRNDDVCVRTDVVVPADAFCSNYMLHPVLIDAMVQAIMVTNWESIDDTLRVPVTVKEFKFFHQVEEPAGGGGRLQLIVRRITVENELVCYLMTENMSCLAILKGLGLQKTSIELVKQLLGSSGNDEEAPAESLTLFEEKWTTPQQSSWISTLWNKKVSRLLANTPELLISSLDCHNNYSDEDIREMSSLCRAVALGTLNALQTFGVEVKPGSIICAKTFCEKFVDKDLWLLMNRLFDICEEEGYLSGIKEGSKQWKFNGSTDVNFKQELDEIYSNISIRSVESGLLKPSLEQLPDVLRGKISALPLLFPAEEKDNVPSAASFYAHGQIKRANLMLEDAITNIITTASSELSGKQGVVLNILEIGAGTGSATEKVISSLTRTNTKFEYTYSDISASFFVKAKKNFAAHLNFMKFVVLDIGKDPLAQKNIPAFKFDLIVAANCFHVTKDITECVRNARMLLKPGGILVLLETFQPHPIIDATVGQLPTYWQFEDQNVRTNHCLLSEDGWKSLLLNNGFKTALTIGGWSLERMGIVIAGTDCYVPESLPIQLYHPKENYYWIVVSSDGKMFGDIKKLFGCVNRAAQHFEPPRNMDTPFNDLGKIMEHYASEQPTSKLEGVVYFSPQEIELNEHILNFQAKQFYNFIRCLLQLEFRGKLFLITKGAIGASRDNNDVVVPTSASLWGIARSIINESPQIKIKLVDLSAATGGEEGSNNSTYQLFTELWSNNEEQEEENQVCLRDGRTKFIPRMEPRDLVPRSNNCLSIPFEAEYFSIIRPSVGSLENFTVETYPNGPSISPTEIQVEVLAYGLNFRDLLVVLQADGNVTGSWGVEFCGIITDVGAEIQTDFYKGQTLIGFNKINSGIHSHLKVHPATVALLPNHWTVEEGCCIALPFMTGHEAFVELAKLKTGENVLIHTASGAVGLIAIQMCIRMGASEIFATAGSRRKRRYLRNILGLKYVFNSRDTKFGEEIGRITGGMGVNVVLNTLTGEGFKEASLSVCAKNGRFVEISKMNIWSADEVLIQRPDVKYFTMDLSAWKPECLKSSTDALQRWLANDWIQPIPYTRFETEELGSALRYFQDAKHIGKVICRNPSSFENGRKESPENGGKVCKPRCKLFNGRSTYLITGGLGGIGLSVAEWMCDNGAEIIVLCSRKLPAAGLTFEKTLSELKKRCRVEIIPANVGIYEECERLLGEIRKDDNLPPLRGIMHAVGILRDGLISDLEWPDFEDVFLSKVQGSYNLHKLTIRKGYNLEHFVMFSSLSTKVGQLGQSNYSGANAFMDSLALHRTSIGLTGSSINWGQWGKVGLVPDRKFRGITPMEPSTGMEVLEAVLRNHMSQATYFEGSFHAIGEMYPWLKRYLSNCITWELKSSSSANPSNMLQDKTYFTHNKTTSSFQLRDELNLLPDSSVEDKIRIFENYVRKEVYTLMSYTEDTNLDRDKILSEIGLDSLAMVELRNSLQTLMKPIIPKFNPMTLKGANTISELGLALFSSLSKETIESNAAEHIKLLRQDMDLGENVSPNTSVPTSEISELSTFFLTGCTGNLGPHILKLLLNLPQTKFIYVLIRAKDEKEAEGRLKGIAENEGILDGVYGKLIPVVGDLTEDRLGIQPSSRYLKICQEVDAIFHCGVTVDHVELYKPGSHIRNVNVLGTARILKMAATGKTKWVFHASSLLALTRGGNNPTSLEEDWPAIDEFDNILYEGYATSKFICDLLMKQALERGIPVKVFRFPLITGHSKTGEFSSITGNHTMCRLLHFLKHGITISDSYPLQLIPVDMCAKLAVRLFFHSMSPVGVYNVTNPINRSETEIGLIARALNFNKKTVKPVSNEEFAKTVLEDKCSPIHGFRELYREKEWMSNYFNEKPALQKWLKNPDSYMISQLMVAFVPELMKEIDDPLEIIQRDLNYARLHGFLDKFEM